MKVLINSYDNSFQNVSGGVQTKINSYTEHMSMKCTLKLFDKWNDKLTDYDILHIFMASSDSYELVRLAKEKKLKIVVSAVQSANRPFRILYNLLIGKLTHTYNPYVMIKFIYDAADAIICETVKEKEFIQKMFFVHDEKIKVIPNGIDFNTSITTDEGKRFFEKSGIAGKYILQVGRFDPNKNQLNVIKAVKDTDMQLVLIGGEDKNFPEYYNECKKCAGNNVHFLGWIEHKSPLLRYAYQNAQTVILPSKHEIFGNSLWEGGICGCNLVATDVLPIRSWGLEKYVLTVKSNSVTDIKNKLLNSYSMPQNNELSEIIKTLFSWELVTDQHVNLYNEVLGNPLC